MRTRGTQYITIAVGSLLAIAIVFAQLHTFHVQTSSGEVKTEKQENKPATGEGTLISLPSFSLPSPLHVSPGLSTHCLFEIFFEDDRAEAPATETPARPQRFLTTLFRVIISPNAP